MATDPTRYAPRLGIDTGGTFTDVVRRDRGGLWVGKVPSTPSDPGDAVVAAKELALAGRRGAETPDLVHGTTVALNAILTGNLARVVWITNAGHEDLIEIGRQDRANLYALEPGREVPPVPRKLRLGVSARRGPGGELIRRFAKGELAELKERVRALRPEAIAIGLLHSPDDPADEHRIQKALRGLKVPITCSADVSAEPHEYERFCTAILNAAVAPGMGAYLTRLGRRVAPGRLRLLGSSRGILPEETSREQPIQAVFSGPAGGVLASQAFARAVGVPRVATLDMGGTSTDVTLVGGGGAGAGMPGIAGLPLAIPAADLHTIGCGGGSIAYADAGGALRVGPQSAGAVPGPACYGIGDEPTVTDAHVALGHLGPETLLAGDFPIDPDRSVRAIEQLGRKLGERPVETARGILKIATTHMARAVLVITAARAVDPSGVPLLAFGGAGGLHAIDLALAAGHDSAWVPEHPGCFSAVGLALAGEAVERRMPIHRGFRDRLPKDLQTVAKQLLAEVKAGPGLSRCRSECLGLLRYQGQGAGLLVPVGSSMRADFDREHQRVFGFANPDRDVELVQLRAAVWSPPLELPASQPDTAAASAGGGTRKRKAPLGDQQIRVFQRATTPVGSTIKGPAVIEESTGTTLVPAGHRVRVEPRGLCWSRGPGGSMGKNDGSS